MIPKEIQCAHLSRLNFPILISCTSPYLFSWLLGGIFSLIYTFLHNALYKQTVVTLTAASNLGLSLKLILGLYGLSSSDVEYRVHSKSILDFRA